MFQQVLKLDPEVEEAQFELARVRVQILIDMGFTRSLSEQAVRTYSTVQQALEALLAGKGRFFYISVMYLYHTMKAVLNEAKSTGSRYLFCRYTCVL